MTAPNIADLKERLDILTVAEHLGAEPKRENCNCYGVRFNPIRDEAAPSNSFKLYTDTGRFCDFASGESGDALDLIAKAKNLNTSAAKEYALSLIGSTHTVPHAPDSGNRAVDLPSYDKALKAAKNSNRTPFTQELYELLHRDVLRYAVNNPKCMKRVLQFLGYSEKHQSLTVTLYDQESTAQAICIRHATDINGQPIKWKTHGSKTFAPYRRTANDGLFFIASGIAEMLIFEILDVDYLVLQSDSIRPDKEKVRAVLGSSLAVFVLDNDESCKKAYEAFRAIYADTIAVDFEVMLDRQLPKGYDLRDFANETAQKLAQESDGALVAPDAACEAIKIALLGEIEKIMLEV